ncbi:E3 ubiquitin-protein ligase NHLRC1-like [Salminus brasiliensis]|uniref:E3 ubiquitin-protein ligase NHLRC1-like n=1 Tax=Salminus brasiliensis TaxID=930266 RepID=UPI003B82F432
MSEAPVSQPSSSGRVKGAEEILAEIRSDLLECKVCFERFSSQQSGRRPRNLPCGHVICLACVCAVAHPVLRQLECPFCRRMCDIGATYDCQALLELQDLLGSAGIPRRPLSALGSGPSWSGPPCLERGGQAGAEGLASGLMRLRAAFGGWGTIVNPTGVAVLGSSTAVVVVVHGGHEKVTIFDSQGQYLHSFGDYGHNCSQLCHILGVAVSANGHIVVTDAGDSSVKVFSSRGRPLVTIFGPFELPWGVDVDNCGRFLVTDAQAGTLWQVVVDFGQNLVLTKVVVLKELRCPRAVTSCRVSGRVAVLEHLAAQRGHNGDPVATRLKLFSKDFVLLTQVDSFSLSLMNSTKLDISYTAFDRRGDVIVADSQQGLIWSLGDLQKAPVLSPLVKDGLVRPVGLVATEQNSLIVLDGGDHAVKIYSASAGDSYDAKRSKSI